MQAHKSVAGILIGLMAIAGVVTSLVVTGCGENGLPVESSTSSNQDSRDGPIFIAEPPPGQAMAQGRFPRAGEVEMGPRVIDKDEGGVVLNGRWKVTIPEGALRQDTFISIDKMFDGWVFADLGPDGIRFKEPVRIEMSLEGLPHEPYTDWTLWYFDAKAGKWIDGGGEFDPETETITTYTDHFTPWGPGRAGW